MPLDPSDDDPFEDPFEDPFAGDPLEDPFDGSGNEDPGADDDLEAAMSSIDRATLLAFVTVGVLVHAGVFAVALGPMLIGFRGQWIVGGTLTAGGVLALVLSVAVYRRYRARQ
ncbi:hypothetical protein SAMN05444422_11067 [Halobiforma haloterrestris]|uniref:DUF7322 domain-containing protein n=1 Tax=Natronobacterium haloterrestre TaxID=148448 RepID=A0A1I1KC04_NATHA|nr:hypothetical protein [Halobiforma haloterrestris]SFC55070.1 hypothetical protein SAMN05444422_11067 [Halobiforma haloterrestris]